MSVHKITRSTLCFGFGGGSEGHDYETIRKTMMKELKNSFRPEFLNRVDDIIVFHKLSKDELKEIVTMMVNKLTQRLSEQDINIVVTDKAKEKLLKKAMIQNTVPVH